MNLRQRFLEVMRFNRDVHSVKWEFGYWGETMKNWYESGLPQHNYPKLPTQVTTPTSSLYIPAWTCRSKTVLPSGIGVMAGGLYWPTQGFPLDTDVRDHLGMDATQQMMDVNLHFCPMFESRTVAEDQDSLTYTDIDGVTRKFLKAQATIPAGMDWPIKDKAGWEKLKSERLNLSNVKDRFPAHWSELLNEYRNRDYPLAIGGYPFGLFGTPSHLLGYEKLFELYYDDPALVHDVQNTFTEVWLATFEEVLAQVEVDHIHFWEDISFGKGPMVSPSIVREFMMPYYKRIIDFLNARGVEIILLDTDGDCNALIPLYLEVGVTGMYPFEAHCGMDIVKIRQQYPELQIMGGIPKAEIAKGRTAIDAALRPAEEVLRTGGYIPFGDHFIPPDVSWEDFVYYRTRLNEMIDRIGK